MKQISKEYAEAIFSLACETGEEEHVMAALETVEAKLFKAIDGMEAVLQHNESDLSSWLPLEYELNQTYAADKVGFSPYLTELRQQMRLDTLNKIRQGT